MVKIIKNFEACEKRNTRDFEVTKLFALGMKVDLLFTKGAFYSVTVTHIIETSNEFWCRDVFSKSNYVEMNETTCKRSLQLFKKTTEGSKNIVVVNSKSYCNLACAYATFVNLMASRKLGEKIICSIMIHIPKN